MMSPRAYKDRVTVSLDRVPGGTERSCSSEVAESERESFCLRGIGFSRPNRRASTTMR